MDKSRVCMSRTINLAKQKNVKKTNLLVFEKPEASSKTCRTPSSAVPPISAPRAKRIRVCTGAELKKMCSPPPCVCPPPKHPVGFFGYLRHLLGFGLKAAVAGSLVYFTWDAGLWGDSEDTEMFYANVCHLFSSGQTRKDRLSPACEAELELMQVPPPPEDKCTRPPFSKEKTIYKIKDTWNHAVTTIFESVVGFPFNIINWCKEKFAEEKCTPVKKQL